MQGIGRRFVYILRSASDPERHYVGVTEDFDERLRWHNEGPSASRSHTDRGYPWLFWSSSVIAVAESENRGKRPKAAENHASRQAVEFEGIGGLWQNRQTNEESARRGHRQGECPERTK
jgi:predicted GIY-YIG superfamily endonuclease